MTAERGETLGEITPARVLIVEDDRDGAEMLADLIEQIGHHASVANTAAAAMAVLDREQPDVVLLDVGLPDENGYEVAHAIRARFGNKIRLVAVTGYSGAGPREQAHRAGFDAFFTKPVRVEDLEHELRGQAELEREAR